MLGLYFPPVFRKPAAVGLALTKLPARGKLHIYEVRQRKDKCGVDLISDALPFGRLWYGDANAVANAIGYEIIRNLIQKLHLLTASPNSLSLSPSHPGQFRR